MIRLAKFPGKCGLCGDPYDEEREHEGGGKYATGTIVRTYRMGQVIEVKKKMTDDRLFYWHGIAR